MFTIQRYISFPLFLLSFSAGLLYTYATMNDDKKVVHIYPSTLSPTLDIANTNDNVRRQIS